MKFTYELDENFQGFPTMTVIGTAGDFLFDKNVPGMIDFNPMMVLHGEEMSEVFKPIRPDIRY